MNEIEFLNKALSKVNQLLHFTYVPTEHLTDILLFTFTDELK